MIIDVLWNNINILKIQKKNNLYISSICRENIGKVRESGFPIYFLKDVSVVSDELPDIIRHRISNINNMKGKLKFKNDNRENIEEQIYDYINRTECRRPTDKFSIKIQI